MTNQSSRRPSEAERPTSSELRPLRRARASLARRDKAPTVRGDKGPRPIRGARARPRRASPHPGGRIGNRAAPCDSSTDTGTPWTTAGPSCAASRERRRRLDKAWLRGRSPLLLCGGRGLHLCGPEPGQNLEGVELWSESLLSRGEIPQMRDRHQMIRARQILEDT